MKTKKCGIKGCQIQLPEGDEICTYCRVKIGGFNPMKTNEETLASVAHLFGHLPTLEDVCEKLLKLTTKPAKSQWAKKPNYAPITQICVVCGIVGDQRSFWPGSGWDWFFDARLCPTHAATEDGRKLIAEAIKEAHRPLQPSDTPSAPSTLPSNQNAR